MAISDISLTAGMRSNLVSLQGTVDLLNRTQERLASGKRVNSPLDNATNYFVAKSHMDRAGDLSVRKDGMGEAIQTVKAANEGITAITDLIASAKGIAQSALSAGTAEAATLAAQFNSILDQIDTAAADSGYKGTNLLSATAAERTLEVKFNEAGDSKLTITGSDATTSSAGLNIADAASNWATATNINTAITALDRALTNLRTQRQDPVLQPQHHHHAGRLHAVDDQRSLGGRHEPHGSRHQRGGCQHAHAPGPTVPGHDGTQPLRPGGAVCPEVVLVTGT